jgi:hypothetical protein
MARERGKTRQFGGQTFRLEGWNKKKSSAKAAKERLKNAGKKVRVIKEGSKYYVYKRG